MQKMQPLMKNASSVIMVQVTVWLHKSTRIKRNGYKLKKMTKVTYAIHPVAEECQDI